MKGIFFFNLFFGFLNYFLNTSWVYSTIFHEHFERKASNLTTNRIETRKNNHTRRIINENIHARRTLKRLNIPTFLADNSAFHLIIRELDGRHGSLGCHFATHALHRAKQNHLGTLLRIVDRFTL